MRWGSSVGLVDTACLAAGNASRSLPTRRERSFGRGCSHSGRCMHWLGAALSRSLDAARVIVRRGSLLLDGWSRRTPGKAPPARRSAAYEMSALHHTGLGAAPWRSRRGTCTLGERRPSGRGRMRQCSGRMPRDPTAAATAREGLPGDQRQRRARRGTNGIGGIVCFPPIDAVGPQGIVVAHVRGFTGVRLVRRDYVVVGSEASTLTSRPHALVLTGAGVRPRGCDEGYVRASRL